jgi:leukotriene-A4 hydrolase
VRHGKVVVVSLMYLAAAGCQEGPHSSSIAIHPSPSVTTPASAAHDDHSYSNPDEIRVRHADLDWDVLFDRKILRGRAILTLERPPGGRVTRLVLDTRDLDIQKAESSRDGSNWADAPFSLAPPDRILGSALSITLPDDATRVRISYATLPSASGLQWLDPPQTAGKKFPFLFTQSEAIHARSWIPLQDSPQVRITYRAHVRTPKNLMAVMSANNDPKSARDGD